MIFFDKEFRKSSGKPIKYKNLILVRWDHLPLPDRTSHIRYKIVSTDSEWRQGISVRSEGTIVYDDQVVKRKWADIWEDKLPREGDFECHSDEKILQVKNIWDTGNGCIESWTNGAAIWIEEIPDGRRYHCNDGHFDDDFNDIVFELTIVGPVKEKAS